METKLGQCFQLSDVINKSELPVLQKVHARYANEFAIYCHACSLYMYVWLLAIKQSCVDGKQ